MIESKYLEFDKVWDTGKTEIWNVLKKTIGSGLDSSHQFILGQIKWYPQWRQYCFFPSPHTVFNIDCMRDIMRVIRDLMDERK